MKLLMSIKKHPNISSFTAAERNVGIAMLFLFITVLSALIYFYFAKTSIKEPFILYTEIDSGIGIKKNMPVLINGFECGYVADITMKDDGNIKLKFIINRNYANFIHTDSVAVITALSVIGEPVVNITIGTSHFKGITEQSTIPGKIDKGIITIAEKIVPFVDNLNSISKKFDRIADKIETATSEINLLVASAQKITDSINNQEGTVGKLVKNSDIYDKLDVVLDDLNKLEKEVSALSQNSNAAMDKTQNVLENINNLIDDSQKTILSYKQTSNDISDLINGDLLKLINNMDSLINSLKILSGDLNKSTREMPDMIEQTRDSMDQVETLVQAFKKHWLVKKYFEIETTDGIIQYEER